MASFAIQSSREQKKAGRRNAQQQKIQQREQQDDEYFWQCVKNHERYRDGGGADSSRLSQEELFSKQGSSGINFQQYDSIPVSRSGPDSSSIAQVENFIDLRAKLPTFLSANLTDPERMNYTNPTPIQRHCVPLSLSGTYDVMACAQTGSGKTVAFLVPLIAHIAGSKDTVKSVTAAAKTGSMGKSTPAVPSAVIIAPTRELATQIELEAHKLTFSSALRVMCVYGGAPARSQLATLAKGVDILVATPGRLNDFLQRGLLSLRCTKFFVLDEADRMLDMGFEPQIRQICERYDLPPSHARRTLMFSATFPDEVQRIAQKYMRTYVFVAVGRVGSTIDSITQRIIESPSNDKRSKIAILLPLLNLEEKTLVFCQKKHVASWLCGQITRELPGARADAIHGDRSQSQRETALEKFRDGSIHILVATDVAARGLDVPGITHVIQFDLPVSKDDFDSYVHRIGRTGRAGRLGVATSFFVPGMDAKLGQNGGIWEPLHQLLVENRQIVPEWFEKLALRKQQGVTRPASKPEGKQPQLDTRRGFDTVLSEAAVSTASFADAKSLKPPSQSFKTNERKPKDKNPPAIANKQSEQAAEKAKAASARSRPRVSIANNEPKSTEGPKRDKGARPQQLQGAPKVALSAAGGSTAPSAPSNQTSKKNKTATKVVEQSSGCTPAHKSEIVMVIGAREDRTQSQLGSA